MTPSIYSIIGRRYIAKKRWFWFAASLAFLLVMFSVIAASKINTFIPHQVPFGIGALLLTITWGMLMSIYWFGPGGKMAPEKIKNENNTKKLARQFVSWYGAVFLSVWFVLGITVIPWLLWKQIINA